MIRYIASRAAGMLVVLAIVAVEAVLVYAHVSSGMLLASLLVLAFLEAAVARRYSSAAPRRA